MPKPAETDKSGLSDTETTLDQAKLRNEQLKIKLQTVQTQEGLNALLVSAADKALEQIQNFQEQYNFLERKSLLTLKK